jgi:hypothetical protein
MKRVYYNLCSLYKIEKQRNCRGFARPLYMINSVQVSRQSRRIRLASSAKVSNLSSPEDIGFGKWPRELSPFAGPG